MIQFLEDLKGVGQAPISAEEREELERLRKDHAKLKLKVQHHHKHHHEDKDQTDDSDDSEVRGCIYRDKSKRIILNGNEKSKCAIRKRIL